MISVDGFDGEAPVNVAWGTVALSLVVVMGTWTFCFRANRVARGGTIHIFVN